MNILIRAISFIFSGANREIVIALIAFMAGASFMYSCSSSQEKQRLIDQQNKTIEFYQGQIDEITKAQEQVKKLASERADIIDNLNSAVDSLRVRINSKYNSGARPANNQSGSSSNNKCGRDQTVGAILNRATDLIRERDEIAAKYNELYRECVKDGR